MKLISEKNLEVQIMIEERESNFWTRKMSIRKA